MGSPRQVILPRNFIKLSKSLYRVFWIKVLYHVDFIS